MYTHRNQFMFIFKGDPVLDAFDRKIPLEGGWGVQGSDSALDGFVSAINSLYDLANNNIDYVYPEDEEAEIPTRERNTWGKGNPLRSSTWKQFYSRAKVNLSSMFVSQAKDALTPREYKATLETILSMSAYDLDYVMLGTFNSC